MRRWVLAVVALGAGCSFTTATGFEECASDGQCGGGAACVQHYCLPLPDGCWGVEGAFDQERRIPVLAMVRAVELDGGVTEDAHGLDAMRLALRQLNLAGGVKTRGLALYACAAGSSEATAVTQAKWMVDALEVPAVLTWGNALTVTIAEQARSRDGALVMSPNATLPSLLPLFQTDRNVWRIAPPDTIQAQLLAELIAVSTDGGTVGVVYDKTTADQELGEALTSALTGRGLTPAPLGFDPGLDRSRATTAVNTLANQSPVATVLVCSPADVVALIEQVPAHPKLQRAQGHRWFLAGVTRAPALFNATTTPELDGAQGTSLAQDAGGAFSIFSSAYQRRYDVLPTDFTAHGYDAMFLVGLAAAWASQNQGGITGVRMREGLRSLARTGSPVSLEEGRAAMLLTDMANGVPSDVEGASGPLDFDLEAGAPSASYDLWEARDGGIRVLRRVQP